MSKAKLRGALRKNICSQEDMVYGNVLDLIRIKFGLGNVIGALPNRPSLYSCMISGGSSKSRSFPMINVP